MQRGGIDPRQVVLAGNEAKCLKIIKDLQSMSGAALVLSDAGFAGVAHYTDFIPHPISLGSVSTKINAKGGLKYTYLNDFALDVRRIFGNFARFNYYADSHTMKLRKDVLKVLYKFESLWQDLIKDFEKTSPGMFFVQPLPELRWCLSAFDESVKAKAPNGSGFLIDYFINPIHLYITDPAEMKVYRSMVKKPISFAEILSKLIECEYDNLDQVKDDVDLIVNNCSIYWSRETKGEQNQYIVSAMKLQEVFLKSLKASEGECMKKPNGALSLMPRFTSLPKLPPPPPVASSAPVLTLSMGGLGKSGGGSKGKSSSSAASSASSAASGLKSPSKTTKKKTTANTIPPISSAVYAPIIPEQPPVAASGMETLAIPQSAVRERPAWELAAEEVWKALKRHPFVDLSKPTVIADFWRPVVMVDPSIEVDYLNTIAHPMDLALLISELSAGAISSPQQFLDMAVTIFQNAIDYNSTHQADSSYAVHLVQRCQLLRTYTYWICLETLPVEEDEISTPTTSKARSSKATTSATSVSTVGCPLTHSAQMEQRKARDAILTSWFIHDTGNSPYTECNKLLKDLQRGRNKNELIQISYFQQPVNEKNVSDYSVYVRNPTDLSTIKYRLDGTLPGTKEIAQAIDKTLKRYVKYGEFIADLRRVFSNALKYNGAHLASDSTGITKLIYEAAEMLQERLEGLLGPFTVHLTERVERARITNAENQVRLAEQRAIREKEEAEAKQFEERVLAELKATDHVFAADYDLEQKRKLTELQLKEHMLQQQRAMLEATNAATTASMEDLGRDIVADDTSTGGQMSPLTAAAAGALFGAGVQVNNSLLRGMHVPPMPGFGLAGKVPGRYAHLVQLKKSVRERAWAYWLATTGTVNQNTAHKSSSSKGKTTSIEKSSRKEGPTIRLPGASTSSTTTATSDNPPPTDPPTTAASTTELSGSTAMEVDTTDTQKTKTKFHFHPPAKRPCIRRTEAVAQAFVLDLCEDA